MRLPAACAKPLQDHLHPDLFRALGDPTRLVVLARLAAAAEPAGVTDIADCCGVHLSGVSRHLAVLKQTGIVTSEKRGREVLYELDCEALSGLLRGLADALDECSARCCQGRKKK